MDNYNKKTDVSDQSKDVKNTPLSAKSPSVPPVTSSEPQNTEVETLSPVTREQNTQLAPMKTSNKWAFWKKGKQRDEQLSRISDGYIEMVDMVRSIRDQADAQHQNNIILRDSLIHLPSAIQSLEGFGKSHEQVGSALVKINEQMENYSVQDERMANTMEGFNDTLKGMDGTSKATIKTFDRVQERMRDSDIRMENLFSNVRQSEEKVSETMTRLQRNMSIFQSLFLLCLIGLIGGLIYLFINKEDFKNTNTQQPLAQQELVTPGTKTNTDNPTTETTPTGEITPEVTPTEDSTPTPDAPTPSEGTTPADIVPSDIAPTETAPAELQPEDLTPAEEPDAVQPDVMPDVIEPQAEQPQAEEPTI